MRLISLLLVLTFGIQGILLNAQSPQIQNAEIRFEFVSKEVKGTIAGFESESVINWEHPEKSIFKGRVQSKTLDTNNGLRNWSLRSGKYFDAKDHPYISFESTKVTPNGNQWVVKGELTIKSTTNPVSIIFKKEDKKLVGTFSLYSIDYGIKIKKQREDNLVKVQLELEVE
ncbi:YceI family protein [Flagellimonas algicola]|uniref:YceI family protein n=1 Tax=Flagellimonas algicola TaxID=2583815 RepID=A0ABY2WNL7_9FLAO|nr:YceI family protein [Allomuricauda algicola]TMU56583.1 YceI family protein [Allomuricauda algicola]